MSKKDSLMDISKQVGSKMFKKNRLMDISKLMGGQNVQERQFNGHFQASGQPKCPL